jgi:phosphopantetheinyl transferase
VFAENLELTPLPVGEEDVEVCLLDLTQLVDTESTASRFLTLREREEYAQLRHPSRRREWLGARVCLKTMLLRRHSVSEPTQCEIVKDASGRPRLSFAPGRPVNAAFDCSLSHKGRFAGAGASSMADTRVGVDVEEVSPRLLRLACAFADDRHLLIHPRRPEERLALLWAVKEACAKAMGGGIGMALGHVTCEETAEGRHHVRTGDGLEFRARDFLHDGYVIAMCLRTEEVQRQGKGH